MRKTDVTGSLCWRLGVEIEMERKEVIRKFWKESVKAPPNLSRSIYPNGIAVPVFSPESGSGYYVKLHERNFPKKVICPSSLSCRLLLSSHLPQTQLQTQRE